LRFRYSRLDPDLLGALRTLRDLRRLFDDLVLRTGGDVEEALRWMRELQSRGYIDRRIDLDRFLRHLADEGIVRIEPGRRRLTGKGSRDLRRGALDLMFRSLRHGPLGEHRTPHEGDQGERLSETRPYRFGDPVGAIDGPGTMREALLHGGLDDLSIAPDDLRVFETEHHTSCATVLLLDVSHSMVLYGEDRITPAKQVALALAELRRTRYPRDALDVVLFGDEARPIDVADLPYANAGPYHTNTRAALQLARRILRRRRHPNRRIVMITDGKPTALTIGGRVYKNPYGHDPQIIHRTIEEAVRCRRERITITTFMIADDPWLQEFVEDMTRACKGQAYFASPDDLGGAVFVDFLRNRRRKT
jgi:Ca-activated chloride channel family protein